VDFLLNLECQAALHKRKVLQLKRFWWWFCW